jgi:hypothetical protein
VLPQTIVHAIQMTSTPEYHQSRNRLLITNHDTNFPLFVLFSGDLIDEYELARKIMLYDTKRLMRCP